MDGIGVSGRAWLMMTVTDRQHGGNDGYVDSVDSFYSWDDTVPNRDGPAIGDVVVLWDKELSLGMSVIEHSIATWLSSRSIDARPATGRTSRHVEL